MHGLKVTQTEECTEMLTGSNGLGWERGHLVEPAQVHFMLSPEPVVMTIPIPISLKYPFRWSWPWESNWSVWQVEGFHKMKRTEQEEVPHTSCRVTVRVRVRLAMIFTVMVRVRVEGCLWNACDRDVNSKRFRGLHGATHRSAT